MEIKLERFVSNGGGTLGLLWLDTAFECFTCEDAFHSTKIPTKTRIPQGRYAIKLKPKGSSRMDIRYTQLFGSMHEGMLELQGVPNYTGILIHTGNTPVDTDGCILVGSSVNGLGGLSVLSSVHAYEVLYPKILAALKTGEVWITITDRDRA